MLTPDELRNELRRAELGIRQSAATLAQLGGEWEELAEELVEQANQLELESELGDQEEDDGE